MNPDPSVEPVNILLVAGILLLSVLLGFLVERIFASKKLRKLAKNTAVEWDEILVGALKGFVALWFFLGGLAVVLKFVPLAPGPGKIIRQAIVILVIFSAVLFFTRLARRTIYTYIDRYVEVPTSLFRNFATVVIYLLGFLLILDYLGMSIVSLITALGVGGLAVAMALQETLSNFFAGLSILMTRKIRAGDYVRLDTGQEGIITDITWRNTTIRGLENNLVIVPNVKLGAAIVTNTHLPEKEMGLYLPVTVAFDNDLALVEKATIEVARGILAEPEHTVPGFEPYIRYSAFTELGVQFSVILRVREFSEQFRIKHEFFIRLHERYNAEGIKFAVPARHVTVEKP